VTRTYADGLPTLTLQLANFAGAPQGWSGLLDRARMADEVGVDRVILVDHVVMGEHIDRYDGGRFPTGPDGQWLEPMTTMAVLAGLTRDVRLSTGIIIAGLRRPVVLAKSAATLDVLSGGRLDLGVGVGWQATEYVAAGLDFAERGRLLDDCLDVCRQLWNESPAELGIPPERVWCEPKPLQPGGVPLWISGRLNANVMKRLVRHGSGWIPWGEWATDVVQGIQLIRAAFDRAGRAWEGFEVRGTLGVITRSNGGIDVDASVAEVADHVAAGVTDFTVGHTFADGEEGREQLTGLVAAFRTAVGRR
jgi:probable F420-dependent oxidoreductase